MTFIDKLKNSPATKIGLIFTVICFLGTWTFVLPFMIIMPTGLMVESYFNSYYGPVPFDYIGQAAIVTLSSLFIVTTFLYYLLVRVQVKRNNEIVKGVFIGYLVLELFIIHPLFFYIWLSQDWNMAGDGQMMFSIMETFPFSSVTFVVIGLLVDLLTRKIIRKKQTVTFF